MNWEIPGWLEEPASAPYLQDNSAEYFPTASYKAILSMIRINRAPQRHSQDIISYSRYFGIIPVKDESRKSKGPRPAFSLNKLNI